jgi:putative membrane protein
MSTDVSSLPAEDAGEAKAPHLALGQAETGRGCEHNQRIPWRTMQNRNRGGKDFLRLMLNGFFVGSADVIPGVSGGTMAFILGIYDELIDSIRAVVPFLKKLLALRWREAFDILPWRFLLPVGLGVAAAILSLARFLKWAMEEHQDYVYALFFGLILASLYAVRKRVKNWRVANLGAFAVATVGAYALIGLTPANTPEGLWFVFISAAIAICAMILPGISGAFILLLLGKYKFIIDSLLAFDVPVILVFVLGAAVGIVAFSNVLRWLLDHHHDLTVAILLGFMLGSLRKIWPWKEHQALSETLVAEINVLPAGLTMEFWIALGLMLFGVALVMGIEVFAPKER